MSSYPFEPSQILTPSTYRRGEPTGMVFCPRRQSSIATMRCGEYQERDGCRRGCANAVPAATLAALRRAQAHTGQGDRGYRSRGKGNGRSNGVTYNYGMCVACGLREAIYAQRQECQRCYQNRRAAELRCAMCGKEKKSRAGSYCQSCGNLGKRKGGKARAAQMRARRGNS